MQRDEAFQEAHAGARESEGGRLLEALLITLPSLVDRYQDRLVAIRDTLRLELRLNLKCAVLVFFYAIVLACVVLSAWVGLNALLYLYLGYFGIPLWAKIAAIVATHLLVLISLARALRAVLGEMGFDRLLGTLGLESESSESGGHHE